MRIEIYTNKNGTTINGFYDNFNALLTQSESLILSLNRIKNYSCLINGGIGSLQSAVDSIELKIQNEETKKSNLIELQRKCDEFAEKMKNTDGIVSGKVSQNQEMFYNINEWSKPQIWTKTFICGSIGDWINDAFYWIYVKTNSINTFANTDDDRIDNNISNYMSFKLNSDGSGPSYKRKNNVTSGSLLSGHTDIDASMIGIDAKIKAEGELIGGSIKSKTGASFKKDNVDLSISGTAEGHLAKGSVSGDVDVFDGKLGTLSGKAKGSLRNVKAKGAAGLTLIEKSKISPSIKVEGSISGNAAEGSIEKNFGKENLDIHSKAEGELLAAKLKYELKFGKITYTDEESNTVKTKFGIKHDSKAEAYLAEGTIKHGFNVLGLKIDSGITGKAGGAGAKTGFDISNEGISVDLGAGLIVGLGVKVDINWSDFDISKFEPKKILPWNW